MGVINEARKTVWHICWEYPPHITGGLGVACSSLVDELSRLLDVEVYHASHISSSNEQSSYFAEPVELSSRVDLESLLQKLLSGQYIPSSDYFMKVQRLCCQVVAHRPVDGVIVHAHDWHSILAAVALKKRYGTPFVLHLHSTLVEREGAHARGYIFELEQWGIEEAEKVICVSAQSASFIAKHYRVDEGKMKVVHNACVHAVPAAGASSAVNTLLFVGRMCAQKSPELMLEIMRRLLVRHPHFKLLMAGEGDDLQQVREVVDFCQLTHSVEILGMLPHQSIQIVYQRADVLCLPSISEPFGIVAVEAAQQGLSVLLSERCGAKELLPSARVVQHRDVSAWVKGIDALISDSRKHRELATSVQKEAASRTWQDAAEEILAIYASLGN